MKTTHSHFPPFAFHRVGTTAFPVLVLLLVLAGCTKQIEFTGEESDPMPVMVSYAEADSVLRVRMTMSRFFLSNEPLKTVDNAVFTVELNGHTPNVAFEAGQGGMYRSTLVIHEGDTLTLAATVPGYGEVKAGCRVPSRPQVGDFTIKESNVYFDTLWSIDSVGNSTVDGLVFNGGMMNFKFTLNDTPGRADYYLVRAFLVKDSTGKKIPLTVNVDDDMLFENAMSEDIIDIGTTVDYSYGTNVIFTDGTINGRSHTVEGWVRMDYMYSCDTNLHAWLEVCAVSRDTYLYLATVRAQSSSDEEMGFFSEPVQIHTNVNGGIGILGAITPVRMALFPLEAADECTGNR